MQTTYPASVKQTAFLGKLGYRGDVNLSSREASALISLALEASMDVTPRSSTTVDSVAAFLAPKVAPVTEIGMYRRGDAIYKVQASKTSGKLYALALTRSAEFDGDPIMLDQDGRIRQQEETRWSFEYAPGAVARLSAADKMTLEEAKQFGLTWGICCVCGAWLSDAKSVAAGIGPVCARRFS